MKPLVFHIRDTRVEVHVSILLLFDYLLYQGLNLNLPVWHITTACLILLGSVLVHELAHVAAFRHLLSLQSCVWIFAVGGLTIPTQTDGVYRGWRMAMVALAGPISNFVLAALSLVMVLVSGDVVTLNLATTTLVINLMIGFFNLIPSQPFDGGHAFATAVDWVFGWAPKFADFLVRVVGTLCGLFLLVGALYLRDLMLGLTALVCIFANTPLSRWR